MRVSLQYLYKALRPVCDRSFLDLPRSYPLSIAKEINYSNYATDVALRVGRIHSG